MESSTWRNSLLQRQTLVALLQLSVCLPADKKKSETHQRMEIKSITSITVKTTVGVSDLCNV